MKAEELMIGDWVNFDSREYKITADRLYALAKPYVFNLPEDFLDDRYSPIPLTKEILFSNGFGSRGCKGELVHKTDRRLAVYYDIDHFKGEDWIVKSWSVQGICGIEYVHEFQHYLRLVGKNELADDFNVFTNNM